MTAPITSSTASKTAPGEILELFKGGYLSVAETIAALDDLIPTPAQPPTPWMPSIQRMPHAGQTLQDPSRQELIESIKFAAGELSAHIDTYHDFDYAPHQVPPELEELRRLQHHLEGSLIDSKGDFTPAQPTQGGDKGEAVAWTNQAQLGFLKNPTYAHVPMAMWAKESAGIDVPLYAAPQPASNAGGELAEIEKLRGLLRASHQNCLALWVALEGGASPRCRDCADFNGRCQGDGPACEPQERAMERIKALRGLAYSSPESLADRVIADKTVIWLRECGFQSAARFESDLRAAIIRACAVPSTTLGTPNATTAAALRELDPTLRCEVCDWPLAESREKGCVPGDCSYRPDDPAEQDRIRRRMAQISSTNEKSP